MIRDCPGCGHDVTSHNDGTCHVTAAMTTAGLQEFPGGCGCTALPFDATCTSCGKPYVCGQDHEPHNCYACYLTAKDAEDARSFGPLIDALQRRNIPVSESDIWNTGGNVMCLGLPITEAKDGPYVMWSDDAEYIGFGVYPDSEGSGLFVDYSDDKAGYMTRPEDTYSWAYGDNAERAADLAMRALPEVVRWLDEDVTITRRPETFMGKEYTMTEATWTRLPVIAGADVEDFSK